MINSWHRFHGRAGVQRVYRKGEIVRVNGATLKYVVGDKPGYKVAVVVSKKVHKSAVKRNRIRRRVYESLRTQINTEAPYHMVITVYDAGLVDVSTVRLKALVGELLQRAGVPLQQTAMV